MRDSQHPVVERIEPEIEQMLRNYGYELVEVKFTGRRRGQTLTVIIDKPGGVDSNDCQYVAQRLSLLLDIIDPIESSYNLIVSSPGLDRPLVKREDFERFAHKRVRIKYVEKTGQRRTVEGELEGLHEEQVVLETPAEQICIAWEDIEAANLVYNWEEGT